jgi:hypothetical protein
VKRVQKKKHRKTDIATDAKDDEFDPIHDFMLSFSLTKGNQIESELQPFLTEFKLAPPNKQRIFRDAYEKYKVRSSQAYELQAAINKDSIIDIRDNAPLKEQLHTLFSYLGLVESLGNCYVDILVLLLVANGRDFHIESRYATPRIRHLMSINDLEKERIPLTTKLNFLRDNGILTFTAVIDNKLRNDIAHLNFNIVNGEIFVRKKPSHEILQFNFIKIVLAISRVAIQLNKLSEEMGWGKKRTDEKT